MCKILVTCLAAFAGIAGWLGPADAGPFSISGHVIAIVAGDLFIGEANGKLDGTGTISIRSRASPDISCDGLFTYGAKRGDAGSMQCSDGTTAKFEFKRLSIVRGYGFGNSSRGPMSFTYGLNPMESEPYLKLPPGKALRIVGKDLELVNNSQLMLPESNARLPLPETAPDMLLSDLTSVMTSKLGPNMSLRTD